MQEPSKRGDAVLAFLAWRVSRVDSSDDESEVEDEEDELEPKVESSNSRLGILLTDLT